MKMRYYYEVHDRNHGMIIRQFASYHNLRVYIDAWFATHEKFNFDIYTVEEKRKLFHTVKQRTYCTSFAQY